MNNKIKDTNIKSHTYYFLDDIINVKSFDPNSKVFPSEKPKKFFFHDFNLSGIILCVSVPIL